MHVGLMSVVCSFTAGWAWICPQTRHLPVFRKSRRRLPATTSYIFQKVTRTLRTHVQNLKTALVLTDKMSLNGDEMLHDAQESSRRAQQAASQDAEDQLFTEVGPSCCVILFCYF